MGVPCSSHLHFILRWNLAAAAVFVSEKEILWKQTKKIQWKLRSKKWALLKTSICRLSRTLTIEQRCDSCHDSCTHECFHLGLEMVHYYYHCFFTYIPIFYPQNLGISWYYFLLLWVMQILHEMAGPAFRIFPHVMHLLPKGTLILVSGK